MSSKGIVDPWRVVAPLRPEEEKPRRPAQKINPDQIDFDAELRITQFYVLSSDHGSIRIDSKDIASEEDAVNRIISALFHIAQHKKYGTLLRYAGVGLIDDGRRWNLPENLGATVRTKTSTLFFREPSFARGMRDMITALNKISREDGNFLRTYGLSTLMR